MRRVLSRQCPIGADPAMHRAVWILDLPLGDTEQGLVEEVVADGVQRLSIELVDRGLTTNTYHDFKTILVDRRPPVMVFRSQQTFIPAGRTVYPLDLDTSAFRPDDRLTSIALVNLNGFTATSSLSSATIRTWFS